MQTTNLPMKLLHGDCLELLKSIPDQSINAVITDPPYGLSNHTQQDIVNALTAWLAGEEYKHGKKGFMGKEWDSFVPSPTIWREVWRVLKPGAHVLCAAGTRTVDLMGISLRLAGFEIRDTIEWLYGSGFPKSLDISKAIDKAAGADRKIVGFKKDISHCERGDSNIEQQERNYNDSIFTKNNGRQLITAPATESAQQFEGMGTALKPAHEPFILARKPIEKGLSIAENCLKWGTGAIDIDGCRVATNDNTSRIQTTNTPKFSGIYRVYNSPIGFITKTNNQGRFPANVIHDGSECVVKEFPMSSSGESSGFKSNKTGFIKTENPAYFQAYNKSYGSAARFFYCAKASPSERNTCLDNLEDVSCGCLKGRKDGSLGSKVINKNHHPTVKPIRLMEYLTKLISRENQVVLDPFMGSGTTGIACQNLGRQFIGIEISKEYYDIAYQRIHEELPPVESSDATSEEIKQPPRQYKLF